MKGILGCDGVDTQDMIQRCLRCELEVCKGERLCAAGIKLQKCQMKGGKKDGNRERGICRVS